MKSKQFQKKILSFYKNQGRDLPWRKTADPYKILISEIMLQQTQVDRVISYYNAWLKKWPTVHKLAKAKRSDVLKQWMGLGYNNRAVNLHKAAQKITKEYKGNVLKAVENYNDIPGIGPYTSAAVRIFAANHDIITVDTNIRRIYMHEFNVDDSKVEELAEKNLPKGRSRDWHNALMDYGATFLTARRSGIKSKTQQSKFEGSDRQIRAKILRLVLKKAQTASQLQKTLNVPQKRLTPILQGMVQDDVVRVKQKKFCV